MHIESINWFILLRHEESQDNIEWLLFVVDSNTIKDLKLDPEKRNWKYLSTQIIRGCKLKHSLDDFDFVHLKFRSIVFQEKKIDYESLKNRMDIIREDLMKECMHPKRLERHLEMGGDGDEL